MSIISFIVCLLCQVRLGRSSILSLWKTLEAQSSLHHHTSPLSTLLLTRTLATKASSDAHLTRKLQTAMAAEGTDQDVQWTGRNPLAELDPDINELISKEKGRQVNGLELIASEVW